MNYWPHSNVDCTRAGIEKQIRGMFELMLPSEVTRIEIAARNIKAKRIKLSMPSAAHPMFDYEIEGEDGDASSTRTI
jgi:hypothetical protein